MCMRLCCTHNISSAFTAYTINLGHMMISFVRRYDDDERQRRLKFCNSTRHHGTSCKLPCQRLMSFRYTQLNIFNSITIFAAWLAHFDEITSQFDFLDVFLSGKMSVYCKHESNICQLIKSVRFPGQHFEGGPMKLANDSYWIRLQSHVFYFIYSELFSWSTKLQYVKFHK